MCSFCSVVWFYFVRHALTMTVVNLHHAFPHYVILDIQLPTYSELPYIGETGRWERFIMNGWPLSLVCMCTFRLVFPVVRAEDLR